MPRPFKFPLLLLAACLLLAGCATNLKPVAEFGNQTKESAALAAKTWPALADAAVQHKIYLVALNPAKLPDEATFQFSPAEAATDEKRGYAYRLEALAGLQKYGAGLAELAGAEYAANLTASATPLHGALKQLNDDLAKANQPTGISDSDLALASTIVAGVGDLITSAMRLRALQRVTAQANPVITKLSGLLRDDFLLFADLMEVRQGQIWADLNDAYKTNAASMTFTERAAFLEMMRQRRAESDGVVKLYKQSAAVLGEIGAAHDKIAQDLAKPKIDWDSIEAAITTLGDKYYEYQKLYDKLKPAEKK